MSHGVLDRYYFDDYLAFGDFYSEEKINKIFTKKIKKSCSDFFIYKITNVVLDYRAFYTCKDDIKIKQNYDLMTDPDNLTNTIKIFNYEKREINKDYDYLIRIKPLVKANLEEFYIKGIEAATEKNIDDLPNYLGFFNISFNGMGKFDLKFANEKIAEAAKDFCQETSWKKESIDIAFLSTKFNWKLKTVVVLCNPMVFELIAQDLTIKENKKKKELEKQIRIAEIKKQTEAEEKKRLEEYRFKLEKICTNLGFGSSEDTLNNCVLLQIQIQATNEENQKLYKELKDTKEALEKATIKAEWANNQAQLAIKEAEEASDEAKKASDEAKRASDEAKKARRKAQQASDKVDQSESKSESNSNFEFFVN